MFNRRKIRIKAWTHLFSYMVKKKALGSDELLKRELLAGLEEEIELLRSDFLFVLHLLLGWAELDQYYYHRRALSVQQHLYLLPSLLALKKNQSFQQLKAPDSRPSDDFIRLSYHDFLEKNAAFQSYQTALKLPSDQGEKLLLQLIKRAIFGRSLISKHLSERNVYWLLNLTLLKRLLLTAIKELTKKQPLRFSLFEEEPFVLSKKFYQALLVSLLKEEEQINEGINRIAEKGWEASRIWLEDRLFILLALVEYKISPATPFPILIHEYMEISKAYSSQKSPIFINAIVDKLRKEPFYERLPV